MDLINIHHVLICNTNKTRVLHAGCLISPAVGLKIKSPNIEEVQNWLKYIYEATSSFHLFHPHHNFEYCDVLEIRVIRMGCLFIPVYFKRLYV